MKVSVLMVTYNHEKFIAQAIESVLMQKVDFEYELMIGEDCSTDNTRQIVIDYQRKYSDKIRLLLPDVNLGAHKNFLNTFKASQGQYLAILEGDDYWTSSEKLQKQVDFLDKNLDFAICFHNVLVFWQDNSYSPAIFLHNQPKTSTIENLLINNFISTPSVMYRAGLVQNFPDWFYEQSMGDWTFHILNAQHGKIGYIDEVMAAYRVHAKGVWSSKSRESQIKETIRMLDTIKYHLSSQHQAIINTSINFYSQQLAIVLKDKELNKSQQQTAYKKTNFLQGQPLVSICIPTYNGEKFIAKAINSVLCQTYPNIEIILSDDNSTDTTVEIAKSFNQKLSFDFLILEHTQYGLAQNWNFSISQAKGKYIKFLFQDDLLEPTAIEEMVNLAEQDEEIGLVFSPRTLFSNTGDTVYDSNFLMHHEAKDVHKAWSTLKPIQSGQQLLQDLNILDNPINKIGEPSTVLIRKDVFEKVGLFNSEFCQLVDLEMWLRIMSQYKVGFVDKVLSHFRIHSQQQTRRNIALKDAILLDYQKLFQTIYSDIRYPQATRQQAIYKYATLSEQNAELHQLRKQIAEECLNISDEQITDMYVGLLGKTHKMLVNSSIKYESLTDEEQIFTNDIVKSISQGFDQPKAIQHLLAAMLYRRADQLPLQYDLSRIPRWLLKDYLQFLFSSPVNFQEPGDADNYYYYMQGWIDYLHTSIFKNSDSQLWDEIVNNFASIANFIPLYFNEHNLKDIYVKRGEIIEFLLELKGYKVDYEFTDRPITRKKIRLGVLAAHFLPGSETFAYLPVYEYISRDFEVILYSLNQTDHPLEQYCRSCANSFKVLPQDLVEQVNIIRADDIDILFIATNVTAVTNQICLLSIHRLARIQVTSGGSVVTTGMRHIDYYISGTLTEPSATAEQQHQEKLVKLEGTAHCFSYGNEEDKVIVKSERQSLGIADDAIIFISGANYFKIIPELIDTWAKIIFGVPKSVLVLLPFGPNWSDVYPKKAFVNHLNKVFSKHGITADRLIVLDPQPVPNRQEVKAYFGIADVYLDSFPFAGTTSLIEPLQVNLPVIARRGTTFRSAMGAAIVQALDVPDLVADSEESYIQLAIALGINPELRQQKSAQIKEKMQGNPSFLDSRAYSAKIGSLFQELFSKYLADTLSQNFRLKDINLIIFPDWLQPEELIGLELQGVMKALATHIDSEKTTLLINTGNIAVEDAELFLSSVVMNLLVQEDLDVTERLEISLVENLADIQWSALLPRIHARIVLEYEDKNALSQAKAETLTLYEIESLSQVPSEQFFFNLSKNLFLEGRWKEAIAQYQKLLEIQSGDADIYWNLSYCYKQLNLQDEYFNTLQQGIKLYPTDGRLHFSLIIDLRQNGRIEEAILSAENAAKCLPDDYTFQILKYLTLPLIYEYQGEINFYRQRYTQGLRDLIEQTSIKTTEDQHSALAGIGRLTNFYVSYQAQNDIDLQRQYGNLVHEIMGVNYPQWVVPLSMPKLQPNDKIRIGYVSHYLYSYSGTLWLTGWLRESNHENFEIYCYYTGNESDPITQKFQEYSDVFHHIPYNLSAACEQIIADKLHILVFPEIGMNPQTMQMAGLRLAPVQCVAWGHPVTTGLPTIDYFLSSELMEPENGQEHYSEKLIRLPNIGVSYPKPYIPPVIKTRSDFGLPDDAVIYLCCQAPFKYLPQYDFIFAEIARRVPQAKLVFLRGTSLQPRLKRAFAAIGLNSEDYCVFISIAERLDYLMINLLSDVYLDTLTWSGGNTTLEAIACNLPIVTCPGEFMRGRHSDSFLKMLGVTDTIAEDETEYIEIAVKLGLDPAWRGTIAERMSQNHDRLFDDKACVAGLEAFYIQAVETSSLYCHDRNYH